MMRPTAIAVVALVSAVLGGTAALAVGKATGWVGGGDGETVVVPASNGATPAATPLDERPPAKPLAGNDFDAAAIYRGRAAGVVTIFALFGDHDRPGFGGAQGSGFVVSSDGYILTNSHVITTAGDTVGGGSPDAASELYVEFYDGERVPGRVVGFDLFNDVGLVKVDPREHPLAPVPLGDSSRVVVGEPVAAIGSPFGNENSISAGIVAATKRSIESLTSQYSLVDAIQTDAPINRGNSGGPLFDARGMVIGINAQIRSDSGNAEGVGFAIPINSAKRSMRQLVETGRVRYAWVGVTTQTVTPRVAERFGFAAPRGAAIQEVVEDSPAEDAGLRGGGARQTFDGVTIRPDGDLIVAINGVAVQNAEDVVRAIAEQLLPGQTAAFTVLRGSERRRIQVILAERPRTPPERGR
jgi:S1-C subfamily serine protease